MKKVTSILIISLIFMLAKSSFAQEEKKAQKIGGIRAGWNYSQYFKGGNPLAGTSDYSSFYVGLFRDNRIIPMLHFGTGVEYYQNGAYIDDSNKRIFQYIGVPLYLKFKIGPVFALSGFELSFLVDQNAYLLGQKYTPTEKANWFDAPFFLGAGVKIFFLSVELRYCWGTIDVYDDTRSQYLQLGGAISF